MKYLSIDIETGGLDLEKHDLLELGIVAETGDPDIAVEDLPFVRILLCQADDTYRLSPWAVENHRSLLADLAFDGEPHPGGVRRVNVTDRYPTEVDVRQAIRHAGLLPLTGREPQNLAGKNLGMFDLPFLEAALGVPFSDIIPHRRRLLDPAILYAQPDDEALPDLAECRRRGEESGLLVPLTDEQKAAHTSLGDCREVIRLLRAKNI